MNRPQTAYAWNEGTAIAYQIVGAAGPDLLFIPGSVTHVEMLWEEPRVRRFLTHVAGFSRLILMDPRGLGLSDRLTEVPTLEERVADLLAVLDAAGSESATLFGNSDTGPACIAAAALHPERVAGLILCGTFAKGEWSEDYPIGTTVEQWDAFRQWVKDEWGKTSPFHDSAWSESDEGAFSQWWYAMMRQGASPRAVLLLGEMTQGVDVRPFLSRVAVPTLVMHRGGDTVNSVDHGRYIVERIPGARWVELPGDEFALWGGDIDAIADEIEEFLTGRRGGAEPTRVVATVMFTDVVGSTERARVLGDRAWTDLIEAHHSRVRAELRRFGGREVDTAGDGFLATFESPTSAIRCARAVLSSIGEIGVDLRIGLHTGECEVVGDRLRGLAVHIGARVASKAGAGEILVSHTVRDLLAGSGIEFDDHGAHGLKGLPGEWRLYAVKN
ncbi:MAG: adenylate/guanylate cyclase domain-containing protein [Actinomycetota bacterium]|nr:adenylate/guanylate cyclase domain-containing protein [Actinomycetota bacterium]